MTLALMVKKKSFQAPYLVCLYQNKLLFLQLNLYKMTQKIHDVFAIYVTSTTYFNKIKNSLILGIDR